MATTTITYNFSYKTNINSGGEHPLTPLNGLTNPPFTVTFDGPDLNPGESVTITGGSGSVPATYVGMDGFGNPVFAIPSISHTDVGILSNTDYPNGTQAGILNQSDLIYCYLAGTRIATPTGEAAVETLAIGDLVLTADGRCVPVKWMGRQTVSTLFGMTEGRRPVSIAAGALGKELPVRDLRVTPDHALLIDGVLVQAGALVNGTSIRRIELAELGKRFTVYHIETENHEIVLAEGVPAETFIDNVTRRLYDNYAEFEALYGAAPEPMQELPQPRAKSFRQVPRSIRNKISERAADVSPRLTGAA